MPSKPSKPSKRTIWWIAGALIVVVALWRLVAARGDVIDTAVVTRGPLEVVIDEAGETRAVDRTVVSAPVTGLLRPRVREEGIAVTTDMPLADLVPIALDPQARDEAVARRARAEALVTAAVARVRAADSAVSDAERTDARVRALADAGAVSARDREEAALQLHVARQEHTVAEAQRREAEAERDAARAVLSESTRHAVVVRSPITGRLLHVHEPDARVVTAGTPLVTVGNVNAMEIRLELLSRDALRVRPGQPMRLDIGPGLEAEPGEIVRVEPGGFAKVSPLGVEERRVRVIGRPLRPLPSAGDGFRVQAGIVVWSGDSVLHAPASAFMHDGGDWAVFVITDGRVERRRVVVGERGAQYWEVREGLREGEQVVRYPDATIEVGARARARDVPRE